MRATLAEVEQAISRVQEQANKSPWIRALMADERCEISESGLQAMSRSDLQSLADALEIRGVQTQDLEPVPAPPPIVMAASKGGE